MMRAPKSPKEKAMVCMTAYRIGAVVDESGHWTPDFSNSNLEQKYIDSAIQRMEGCLFATAEDLILFIMREFSLWKW